MKRFLLPCPPGPDGMIRLGGRDFHYLARVRRLQAGMDFDALLPGGAETRVRVLSTLDNILTGKCLPAAERRPSPSPAIALFQGLPKGAKMDLIVRQAAEGGVSLIAPFESEYSTVRLSKDSGEKLKRWERIVKEARQQSGSAVETEILPPRSFEAALAYWESLKKNYRRPRGLFLHQDPLAKGTFHDYLDGGPDFVALAVGPEGGFSPAELSRFLSAGWKPLIIGDTVLRAETAAVYGTAAVRIILLESETWTSSRKKSCSSEFPST